MKPLVRNPDIVWRTEKRKEEATIKALEAGEDVADKGTVTLIIGGMMHQLNLVGGRIWSLCDGARTLDDVVEAMAAEFDVEKEELALDVEEFVGDLFKRGWLSHD